MRTPKFLPGITFLRDPPRSFSFRRRCSFVGKKGNKKVENRIWELSNGEGGGSCRIVASYTTYLPSRGTQFFEGIPLPVFILPRDKKGRGKLFFCLSPPLHSALLGRYPLQIFDMLLVFEYFCEQMYFLWLQFFSFVFPQPIPKYVCIFAEGRRRRRRMLSPPPKRNPSSSSSPLHKSRRNEEFGIRQICYKATVIAQKAEFLGESVRPPYPGGERRRKNGAGEKANKSIAPPPSSHSAWLSQGKRENRERLEPIGYIFKIFFWHSYLQLRVLKRRSSSFNLVRR